ncbi:MAG: hypothetical protein N3B11_07745 [Coriobacteriia bacterium]|nr:hypothetical protein [Coriobacteriia bacterium]
MMHAFPYRGVPFGRGLPFATMHDGLFPVGAWILGFLFMTALVALTVWLVVRVAKHASCAHHPTAPRAEASAPAPSGAADDAIRIARERLARGEIDVEQYHAIVRALTT